MNTTPPANPFWQGYTRSPEVTERLLASLRAALYAHPQQRLGQILANSLGEKDMFNIYDEDVSAALDDYVDRFGNERD